VREVRKKGGSLKLNASAYSSGGGTSRERFFPLSTVPQEGLNAIVTAYLGGGRKEKKLEIASSAIAPVGIKRKEGYRPSTPYSAMMLSTLIRQREGGRNPAFAGKSTADARKKGKGATLSHKFSSFHADAQG